MANKKFELTPDLIEVDSEKRSEKDLQKEMLAIRVSKHLKRSLQMWCLEKDLNMTEAVERAIKKMVR